MSKARPNNMEEIHKHKETCSKILSLSPKIRYVGMVNAYGKTLAASLKGGLRPLFRPEEARDEFFLTATRESLRKAFVASLGKNNFTLTVHDKVKIVSFSSDTVIFYITVEKDTSYDEIVKIVETASKFRT
ncbi:MAG: hypothetical protein ACRD5H_18475 [Nitrososphaerales archaeon]